MDRGTSCPGVTPVTSVYRRASVPNLSIVSMGSTTFPFVLLIFWPLLSFTNPAVFDWVFSSFRAKTKQAYIYVCTLSYQILSYTKYFREGQTDEGRQTDDWYTVADLNPGQDQHSSENPQPQSNSGRGGPDPTWHIRLPPSHNIT